MVNYTDKDGSSALHFAASRGYKVRVRDHKKFLSSVEIKRMGSKVYEVALTFSLLCLCSTFLPPSLPPSLPPLLCFLHSICPFLPFFPSLHFLFLSTSLFCHQSCVEVLCASPEVDIGLRDRWNRTALDISTVDCKELLQTKGLSLRTNIQT